MSSPEPEFDDDNKTIFSGDLDPEEKAAMEKGEARGKCVAMAEDPERFGFARQRALDMRGYGKNWMFMFARGKCKRCPEFIPRSKTVGGHCKLPENRSCIKD